MSKPSMFWSAGWRVVTCAPSRSLEPLKKLVPPTGRWPAASALRKASSPVDALVALVGDDAETGVDGAGDGASGTRRS